MNVALDPCVIVWLIGWVVMAGGTVTVKTALALVTLPAELEMKTE